MPTDTLLIRRISYLRGYTLNAGFSSGHAGNVVLQEAKGIVDRGVSVYVFLGTITRTLPGQLSVTCLHALEQEAVTKSYNKNFKLYRYTKVF